MVRKRISTRDSNTGEIRTRLDEMRWNGMKRDEMIGNFLGTINERKLLNIILKDKSKE